MSAIAIKEKTYPIVYVHFQGASTVENTQDFLDRFSQWLSRQELFGLILRQTEIEHESIPPELDREVHRAIAQWAKQNKPQIARYCVGMAMVFDSPDAFEKQQAKLPKMINTLFGCSGTAFTTTESAEAWIEVRLTKSA